VCVHALTPLGGWQSGFATFYGGAPDGDSPYSPSFGTLDVRAAAALSQQLSFADTSPLSCWYRHT